MKVILLSIRPEHAYNIIKGRKTLELRKSVPKDFVGWVYVYVTKGKRLSVVHDDEIVKTYYYLNSHWGRSLNQDIPFRFWFDEYDVILNQGSRFIVENKDEAYTNKLARESCLDYVDLKRYLKDKNGCAWHIKKLEIFDKPMELSDFIYASKKPLIDKKYKGFKIYKPSMFSDIVDGEPQMIYQLTKAPQSYQYVWVKEN